MLKSARTEPSFYYQLMPVAVWLKSLLRHIPDKGEPLVRYCCWYGNQARGIRRLLADPEVGVSGNPEFEETHADSEF